jgi:methionyl-tRNA formyltransferase
MKYRVVFMGSPEFAIPTLKALLRADDFEVAGVITQPDRPAGRGSPLKPPPVKEAALEMGIEVFQPEKLRGEAVRAKLTAWKPDVQVVAAYGQILKDYILDIPIYGSINVHASLLPRWRGAAPIQAAIRAGDKATGITIMKMDVGLDTGPMLIKETVMIAPDETATTLHDKLSERTGSLLLTALRLYLRGLLTPVPQDDTKATFAPQIRKEEGQIDWAEPAVDIDRLVRAFTPWPGTFTHWNGKLLKIIAGQSLEGSLQPGQVAEHSACPVVIGTGSGLNAPAELQLEGKKRLAAVDFCNGNREYIGAVLPS